MDVEKVEICGEQREVRISSGRPTGLADLWKVSKEEKEQAIEAIRNKLEGKGKRPQQAYYNPKTNRLQIMFLHN